MDHLLQNYLVCQFENTVIQYSFQSYLMCILRSVVWVSKSFKIVPWRCFSRLRCKNHQLKWRDKAQLSCCLTIIVTLLQKEAEGGRHVVSMLHWEVEPRSEFDSPVYHPYLWWVMGGFLDLSQLVNLKLRQFYWFLRENALGVAEENWVCGSLGLQKMHSMEVLSLVFQKDVVPFLRNL